MSEELKTGEQEAQIPASVETTTEAAAEATPTAEATPDTPAATEGSENGEAPAESTTEQPAGEAENPDGGERLPPPPAEVPAPEAEATPAQEAAPAESESAPAEIQSGTGASPEVKKPVITVKAKPKFQKKVRPQISDEERKQMWMKDLKEYGGFTDDAFIAAVADYAMKNHGYNSERRWGGCLKVMVNRLAQKCRNSLRTFSPNDAKHIITEIERFLVAKPLGANAQRWNEDFPSNMKQREVVSEFFRINSRFSEMAPADVCMTAIRDAAWPTLDEEKKGTGGSFAERFHYLIMCIIRLCTTSEQLQEGLFGTLYHSEPSEAFLERFGGGVRRQEPDWIKDGKCGDCGSDLTKDADGNVICSNVLCDHNIASVAVGTFRNRGGQHRQQRGGAPRFDPNNAPLPTAGGGQRRKRNWKERGQRGDQENLNGFHRGKKRHGQRFHENQEDLGGSIGGDGTERTVVATPGGENLGNLGDALAGVKIQTPETPAQEAASSGDGAPAAEAAQ